MFKIGFDAKRYFTNATGLGNYSRDLIRILSTGLDNVDLRLYTPKVLEKYSSSSERLTPILPRSIEGKLFPQLWRSTGILSDLKRDQIDIFHGLSGELPIGISGTTVKSVVTMHDLIFLRYPEWYGYWDRKIYNKKFKQACHEADSIVAISEQTKKDLQTFFAVPEKRIQVIYQGCHPEFKIAKTADERIQLLKKLGIPSSFLLNVGTIEPRKNILSVIQALEEIDYPLVIVGKKTDYQTDLQKFIAQKKMHHRIFFVEGLSMRELSILYGAATAFVYPSKFEGFGIPIIEALYSGTPVISNKEGVFPEAGGPSSAYVDINCLDEIKHAIMRILESESLRAAMTKDGIAYAQRFNDDKLLTQWRMLYLSLLD
ncbi:glycosyltransferase family 4 protein [Sphingobacterium sp. SYP-B4668]|uniref:glycosyltransferase family 4 protein n=1 Tax=Sphingobacterium sp. SYP-B4668 TaxID=2996035 RepID=UPI0022DD3901|nr:glycosyltransferase family 1 protein [Sphingobacterium sp. SYP-B4668]